LSTQLDRPIDDDEMPSLMTLMPWRRRKRTTVGHHHHHATPVAVRTRRGGSLGAMWRRVVRTITCTRTPAAYY
jgi:hypothetical protein